ncbi:MAG: alpha/beta hydrolase [Clostridia bacterium]|nr:alpha/beta hydrolase [Clostridia bacterium]
MELTSFDGKKIYVHEWSCPQVPKGVVQIIHGMTEHAARYDKFAKMLNAFGYFVVADDHRGHGKTDPDTLGYCKGNMFADTVRDECAITDYYQAKFPDLKYFVFGFSYGSFITQSYIGKYGDKIDGAVIGGSNMKKDFEVYLGSFVAALNPKKKPAKMIENLSFGAYEKKFEDKEWLSANPENNAAYHADPLCGFTCSYRFYADFFKGLKSLYTKKYAKAVPSDLPILLASGKEDPVGDMSAGVKKLYSFYQNKASVKDIELKLFEGCRHEFLNEKTGEENAREILEWFEKHC